METKLGRVFIEFSSEKIHNFLYSFFRLKKGGGGIVFNDEHKSSVYDDTFTFDCKLAVGGVLSKATHGPGGN